VLPMMMMQEQAEQRRRFVVSRDILAANRKEIAKEFSLLLVLMDCSCWPVVDSSLFQMKQQTQRVLGTQMGQRCYYDVTIS
jgi:hypothetical protein